jgi:hypothetical protein
LVAPLKNSTRVTLRFGSLALAAGAIFAGEVNLAREG